MRVPAETFQLEFLSKIQRLFAEGDFTATYKYALLIAIADLSVELGGDSDDRLVLTLDALGRKFVELYWNQALPYSTPGKRAAVLIQNNGSQAAVISAITDFRRKYPNMTLALAQGSREFGSLVRRVRRTLAAQPVPKLQKLGPEQDPFLYEEQPGQIVLNMGVAFCMRRFQPLIQSVARTHWLAHVKKNAQNAPVLGGQDDLSSFMFGVPRRTLREICGGLRALEGGDRCFYCRNRAKGEFDVDHFIPLATYPRDLCHNFVISCPTCNRSKSDTLAAREHLERWVEFVDHYGGELADIGAAAGCPVDHEATRSVARWAYQNGASSGAQAWLGRGQYEQINDKYLDYF